MERKDTVGLFHRKDKLMSDSEMEDVREELRNQREAKEVDDNFKTLVNKLQQYATSANASGSINYNVYGGGSSYRGGYDVSYEEYLRLQKKTAELDAFKRQSTFPNMSWEEYAQELVSGGLLKEQETAIMKEETPEEKQKRLFPVPKGAGNLHIVEAINELYNMVKDLYEYDEEE
jgi:hypothetical protein